MNYFETIHKRYSVRAYKDKPVEQDKLDKVIESAIVAPTAVNKQGFRVFLIETAGRREELARIYRKEWFSQAPLLLLVCAEPDKCWTRRDGKYYGDVDAAIVMDHIILAATALGLGTCWVAAFDAQAARDVLRLDDGLEPIAFTPLGYAADEPPARRRKSREELVEYVHCAKTPD